MFSRKSQKKAETVLVDLINSKSNNNKCGECGATFPTWASVNLGIFLCGRCASVHRNLGDDISVVKSLTLDKWSNEELDSLASIGNKKAARFWNPKNEPFPFDDDDKDEIYQYVRNKYVLGKFRYSEPTKEDYNLQGNGPAGRKDRIDDRRSRRSRAYSRDIPKIAHRDIPEIERLKYRKLEPKLQEKGFNNINDNYEALSLSKGNVSLAVEILSRSDADNYDDSNEVKPKLPARPGSQSVPSSAPVTQQPTASNADWWANNNNSSTPPTSQSISAPVSGGLIEPPQQYLDPATGIIYVDPVQQQLYEQQQAQLLQQQQTAFQVIPGSGAQQYQAGFQQPQGTGIDKNQLLSLYNTGAQQQPVPQQQQPLMNQFTSAPSNQGFPQQFGVSQATGSPFQANVQQQQNQPFYPQQQQQQQQNGFSQQQQPGLFGYQ